MNAGTVQSLKRSISGGIKRTAVRDTLASAKSVAAMNCPVTQSADSPSDNDAVRARQSKLSNSTVFRRLRRIRINTAGRTNGGQVVKQPFEKRNFGCLNDGDGDIEFEVMAAEILRMNRCDIGKVLWPHSERSKTTRNKSADARKRWLPEESS